VFKLPSALLGQAFIEDVLNRIGSLAYWGLNLNKEKIVERPSLKEQNDRIGDTITTILKGS